MTAPDEQRPQPGPKRATTRNPPRSVAALVAAVRHELDAVADPSLVKPMEAYMKGIAPFLGVSSVPRRAVTKALRSEAARLADAPLLEFTHACFAEPERELHYVAIDVLTARAKTLDEQTLPSLRALVLTKSWWDTVDPLSGIVGAGVARFSSWETAMDEWSHDSDVWIRRVAILHQLGRGHDTDRDRLFRIVLENAYDREFFIRKAIGWALRDLAWKQPQVIADFVDEHRAQLAPLSVREATKNFSKLLPDYAKRV